MTKKRDENITKSEALKLAWKNREDYILDDKGIGSLYTSWRSRVFTIKGKKEGFPVEWKTYKGFKKSVGNEFEKHKILIRVDSSKPYSSKNCFWGDKGQETFKNSTKFTYNNVEKYLFEWCIEFDLNLNGVKQRYFKGKNYTKYEILFGKKRSKRKELKNVRDLGTDLEVRSKVSKMLSSYKNKDFRKSLSTDIDRKFVYDTIHKKCVYCGTSSYIGLDRIDNSKGHLKDNCVPSCYRCNVTRLNNFSYNEMITLGKTIQKIDYERKNIK